MLAGIVAALGKNRYCSVGIAYDARVGMVKLHDGLSGLTSDLKTAAAISYKNSSGVDIYVVGLGPKDDGSSLGTWKKNTLVREHAYTHARGPGGIVPNVL